VPPTGLAAFGSAAAVGQTTDEPADGPMHRAIRQDDGTYEVVPLGDGGAGTSKPKEDCGSSDYDCTAACCYQCECDCCDCHLC
jgi:hypothetical protein